MMTLKFVVNHFTRNPSLRFNNVHFESVHLLRLLSQSTMQLACLIAFVCAIGINFQQGSICDAQVCKDDKDNCRWAYGGMSVCKDYAWWAKINCARTCKFCTGLELGRVCKVSLDCKAGLQCNQNEMAPDKKTCTEFQAGGTIEVYFVFDPKAYRQYIEWGQAQTTVQAKNLALQELDYMLTELNIHYESLSGLGLKIGRRDVKFLDNDLFTERYGVADDEKAKHQFNAYLERDNAKARLQYDMTVLLTGYDLGSANATAKNSDMLGFAELGGVCSHHVRGGTGVVEFRGTYETIRVVAHETGHLMGSEHDLKPDGIGHTMSGYQYDSINWWSFSRSSHGYISKKIEAMNKDGKNCLKETNRATVIPDVGVPDGMSTPNKVCQRIFGLDTFMCGSSKRGDNLCSQLSCLHKGLCWPRVVVSDGMPCGKGKSCRKRKCVSDPRISKDIDDECPIGDVALDCDQSISRGYTCNTKTFRDSCCKTCGELGDQRRRDIGKDIPPQVSEGVIEDVVDEVVDYVVDDVVDDIVDDVVVEEVTDVVDDVVGDVVEQMDDVVVEEVDDGSGGLID